MPGQVPKQAQGVQAMLRLVLALSRHQWWWRLQHPWEGQGGS